MNPCQIIVEHPAPCVICGHLATIGTKAGTIICDDCARSYLPGHPLTYPAGHVAGTEAERSAMR